MNNKIVLWSIIGLVVAFVVCFGLSLLVTAAGGKPGFGVFFPGIFLGVFVAYIGGNLAGNRKTPAASESVKASALSLVPPAGQALLIVYREGFVGMAAGMNVVLDGKPAAQLKSPRFTAIPVAPGSHTLQLGYGGLAKAQNRDSEWPFTAEAGGVIAFRATMAMGALKNSIAVVRVEADSAAEQQALRGKLSGMIMTAPDMV